ncbi:MAG: Holliday junction branch migration protein RuvA [Candidatus Cloacimonetes bacterium]|nr:Holliday junction branch migration protein RuvA [Candidatus Cloacimonadota bacterium]
MIVYLKGTILNREPGRIFLNTGNIGYAIYLDMRTECSLKAVGEVQELYTAHIIREQEQSMYGFDSLLKLEVFELLMCANKVGPKVALSFISALEPQEILKATVNKDIKRFGKIPGAGPKILAQVILDCEKKALRLAEKYQLFGQSELKDLGVLSISEEETTLYPEVFEALKRLGFTPSEIKISLESVKKSARPGAGTEEVLSACLRYFYAQKL